MSEPNPRDINRIYRPSRFRMSPEARKIAKETLDAHRAMGTTHFYDLSAEQVSLAVRLASDVAKNAASYVEEAYSDPARDYHLDCIERAAMALMLESAARCPGSSTPKAN